MTRRVTRITYGGSIGALIGFRITVEKTHILFDGLLDFHTGLHHGLPGLVHSAVQEPAEALRARQRLRGNCWQKNGKGKMKMNATLVRVNCSSRRESR